MLNSVMKRCAMFAIRLYQKYISPHKGFCCAFRFHTHKQSCSAFGYRSIRMFGILKGVNVLRARLGQCSSVNRAYSINRNVGMEMGRYVRYNRQAGFVDSCDCGGADCSGCDAPDLSCDMPSVGCDSLNPFDCSLFHSSSGVSPSAVLDVLDASGDVVEYFGNSSKNKKSNVQNFLNKKRPVPKKYETKKAAASSIDLKKSEKLE